MSIHADWLAAKTRRDTAAVSITRAIIAHRSPTGGDLARFARADADMARIEADLDPITHASQERP